MGLLPKRFKRRYFQRVLSRNESVVLEIIKEHPDLVTKAVLAAYERFDAENGGPERRTKEFPVMTQMGTGIRYGVTGTIPKLTPFNLRRFSEYPPSRRAINAICNPILDMPWEIARISNMFGEPLPDVIPQEQKNRMMAISNCLERPNNDDSWRTWLEVILEDIVVGGYGAAEIAENPDPMRPLYLWPVDGQSIRINLDWNGSPKGFHYAQSMGYTSVGIASTDPIRLRDEQLLYFKFNPRSNTPFGLGYLEVAFLAVNAFLGAFDYATRRASNATPSYIIFLGENVDMATARQWQQFWQQTVEGAGRAPIIGGGRQPNVQPLIGSTDDALFLQWQEFLIRNIAMAFGVSTQKLNIDKEVNRSTAVQADTADWDTVAPVANHVADYITNRLIHQRLGWTDLEFKWLIRDTDELRQSEILLRQYESNGITINEIRDIWGREPIDETWGNLSRSLYEEKARAEYAPDDMSPMGGPPIKSGNDLDVKDEPKSGPGKPEGRGPIDTIGATEGVHKYGTTQLRFTPNIEATIRTFGAGLIPVNDLYAEEGFEHTPHVTVKYGITENIAEALPVITDVVRSTPAPTGTFGKLEIFAPPKKQYDVVVMRVESPSLVALNAALVEAVPSVNTFRNYRPHVTLAYVLMGHGARYKDVENPLEGTAFLCEGLEFIDRNGNRTLIPFARAAT